MNQIKPFSLNVAPELHFSRIRARDLRIQIKTRQQVILARRMLFIAKEGRLIYQSACTVENYPGQKFISPSPSGNKDGQIFCILAFRRNQKEGNKK